MIEYNKSCGICTLLGGYDAKFDCTSNHKLQGFERERLIYPPDFELIGYNEYSDGVYCISQGGVDLFVKDSKDQYHLIYTVAAGELLGLQSYFLKKPNPYLAITRGHTHVCKYAIPTFERLLNTYPALKIQLMKYLSCQLDKLGVEH